MPALTVPPVDPWVPAPVTKEEDLEWADLTTIDLEKCKTPEGRAEQAKLARDAMHRQGFFYVINHGLDQATVNRLFDIAALPFDKVEQDEKIRYEAKIKQTGTYLGYKLPQYWHIANGVRDRIEHYNFPRELTQREHPTVLRPYLPEVQKYVEFTHVDILNQVQKLLSLGLELPENTLTDMHPYDETNFSFGRFMMYNPRPQEEEERTEGVWMKGHADHTSMTALWSQPVTALQIKDFDGQWRYIRHKDNALVINCGDTLEYLSGGYYKSAIHRVVKPPADQDGYRRLGLFYFMYTADSVRLAPLMDSPVLQREGVTKVVEGEIPTEETWRKTRTATYGVSDLKKSEEAGIEYEIVNGVQVKHYN
ncbi:Clavaminate synthase-like protein [Artomyces pyxidatus]|uniref:Clavaminate synthase-like protein n=1 Tax=Artomyces pyxidatus TaxID=48021 RepID=A0ACB8T7S9_9AGAM|nr:Clavaminate synthase-like protein [Artomyces pyxidatus]